MSMELPWTRARKLQSTLQEQRITKEGGRQQPNSGRFWRFKRDGIIGNFLIEKRTTEHGSYSIKRDEWVDIRKNAFQTPPGLLPALQIDIQDVHLLVIEMSTFEEMHNQLIAFDAQLEMGEP